jgi:hypothetical protein
MTAEATNTTSAAVPPPPIVAPEPVATTPPTAPEPVATTPPVATVPAEIASSSAPAPAAPVAAAPVPPAAEPAPAEIKPRVLTREGYVHKSLNVNAPTDFELRDVTSKSLIEYLQPDPQDKTFKKYLGKRVLLTGIEWLDPRWPKMPFLRIQTVDPVP